MTTIVFDATNPQFLKGIGPARPEVMNDFTRFSTEIKKFFVLNSYNYWDVMSYFLVSSSSYFREAPSLNLLFKYISFFDEELTDGAEVIIRDYPNGKARQCAELVARERNLHITLVEEGTGKKRRFVERPSVVLILLQIRFIIRYVIGLVRRVLHIPDTNTTDVLLLSNTRFSAQKVEDNQLFGSIVSQLNTQGIQNKVLRYERLTQTNKLTQFVKSFMWHKTPYLGDYYSLSHLAKNSQEFRQLRRHWKEVKDNDEFKGIFSYKGYNIYSVILPRLQMIFSALSYVACDMKNISEKVIHKEDYSVLVIDHEENMLGKAFMLQTRNESSKKTIALSYELVYPGCSHTHIDDPTVRDRSSPYWRPLPEAKCVWGDYAKQVLKSKGNYPPHLLVITGNPKFDPLFRTDFDPEIAMDRLNLSREKTTVLCTLNGSIEYLDKLHAISLQHPFLQFIIKPHPNERKISQIRKRIRDFSTPNLIYADHQAWIIPLIYLSDYVLMMSSSVGFEAMLMGKIVFSVDQDEHEVEGLPFKEYNATIHLASYEQLVDEIKRIEGDEKYVSELQQRIQSFVNTIHYKNDGKASQRVVDVIVSNMRRQ